MSRSSAPPKGHKRVAKGRLLEDQTIETYRRAGWTVVRGGWPDLLCYRKRFDSSVEIQFLECKTPGSGLRKIQRVMHEALKELGFSVEIENGTLEGRPWIGSTAH